MMFANKNEIYKKGSVLIVTIWVVMALASLVLVIARQMRTQAIEVSNQLAASQADAIASGAIEYCKSQLENEDSTVEYTSSSYEAVEVGDGYFWIIRPNLSDDKNYDYGLSDEASKINLNSASLEMLLKLPGMTSELASSIIDWRDEDSEITTGGAESEYYLLLSDKYNCKNSDLETIEEVLLIKGADKDILFGEDWNLNGVLDDNENDAEQSSPSDNSNGTLDPGFYNYVTVYSYEENVDSDGQKRINVSDMQNQRSIAEMLEEAVGSNYFQIMDGIRAGAPFDNLLEVYYASSMTYEQFVTIIDKITTSDDEQTVGLVNVNNAPEQVLLCLPQLEQSDVDALITERNKLDDDDLDTILWVTKAIDREKAEAIGGYITVQSSQYCADIVAVSGDGRAFRRYRAIIDSLDDTITVVYKKQLTHLGWPIDNTILENLRQGKSLQ